MPGGPEPIVIDTGPLIALARADALVIAGSLPIKFLCPPEVRVELDEGASLGHPAVNPPWLHVVAPVYPLDPVAGVSLGLGEAAAIHLALDRRVSSVCIDDWKGRKVAIAIGLRVTGTLGLLGRAKALGLLPTVRPVVERLERSGAWFDPELVRRVLLSLGE